LHSSGFSCSLRLPGETCTLTITAQPDTSTQPGTSEGEFFLGTVTQEPFSSP
jgi:hypothetical protein